jgi:hypothetical protein
VENSNGKNDGTHGDVSLYWDEYYNTPEDKPSTCYQYGPPFIL